MKKGSIKPRGLLFLVIMILVVGLSGLEVVAISPHEVNYGPVDALNGNYNNSKVRTGDFNGDGKTDFALYFDDNGSWSVDVYLASGSETTITYTKQRWATRQGGFWESQKWYTGDFNVDGKTDFAKYWNDNNTWTIDVHLSTGSSFAMYRWATQQGGYWDSQKWFIHDFNGDGKTDFAKIFNDNGVTAIDVHLSTGSSFTMNRWPVVRYPDRASLAYSDNDKWLIADFNRDGRPDFLRYWNDAGCWSADKLSNYYPTPQFYYTRVATKQGGYWEGQKWTIGDFNGDGITDVAKYWNDGNKWTCDVHLWTGHGFEIQRWATQQQNYSDSQKWFTGAFNGDGKTDFVKFWANNFYYYCELHPSSGSGFNVELWSQTGRSFQDQSRWFTGDFNGDSKTDLIQFGSLVHTWISTGTTFNLNTYILPGNADMEIRDVTISPIPPVRGEEATFTVQVKNVGDAVAKNVRIRLFLSGVELPNEWGGCGLVSYDDVGFYELYRNFLYLDTYFGNYYVFPSDELTIIIKANVKDRPNQTYDGVSITAWMYCDNDVVTGNNNRSELAYF